MSMMRLFLSRAAGLAFAFALSSCSGSQTSPTCGADDLDCFMSHLLIRDAAGTDVHVDLVDAAAVSGLSAATKTSSTAPQLTSGPASLSFAYGTLIEGVDVPLTDRLDLGFTDPNGCQPIVALTLSKNGKTSGHTGCFPGLRDHRTSGTFTRSLGFTASAPAGASFDLQMVVISSADCTSIDKPLDLFTTNGTYATGVVAGTPVTVPVTIAPPPTSSSSGSNYFYANWDCKNQSGCIADMGHNLGSAGPFCTSSACLAWKNAYMRTSTCDPQANSPIYNAPPAGTCQN
jgi:hypothetical protein